MARPVPLLGKRHGLCCLDQHTDFAASMWAF